MEKASNQGECLQLQSYTNEMHGRVNFLFQRRRINTSTFEPRLELTDTEIKFVASAFTENFMDAPDMVEITLVDDDHPASDRGVLIITEHADHDSIYSSLYAICAHNNAVGPFATKDVRRIPADFQPSEDTAHKVEVIHDDTPVDESERNALMKMIQKL